MSLMYKGVLRVAEFSHNDTFKGKWWATDGPRWSSNLMSGDQKEKLLKVQRI
jgi:hypothetical protein